MGQGDCRQVRGDGGAFQWNGCYPKKKQWCLDNLPLRHPWVLYCDADERITSELADEIALAISGEPVVAGYFIRGQPVFGGVRHRHGAWNRKLALIDRRRASFPSYPDLDIDTMWEVEGITSRCFRAKPDCSGTP